MLAPAGCREVEATSTKHRIQINLGFPHQKLTYSAFDGIAAHVVAGGVGGGGGGEVALWSRVALC